MQEKCVSVVALVDAEQEKQLQEMKSGCGSVVATLNANQEKQLQEMKGNCESVVALINAEHEKRLQETNATLHSQISTLQAELAAAREKIGKRDANILKLRDEVLNLRGNVRVFARIRPVFSQASAGCDEEDCVQLEDDQTLLLTKMIRRFNGLQSETVRYSFDKVLGADSSNENVYSEIEPLARSVCLGHHVTIFAFGATNSGKTFTMFGGENFENRGVISRVLETIFDMSKAEECDVSVELTCQEIYMEKVIDLSTGSDCSALNARRHRLSSAEDFGFLEIVKKRRTSATNINEESSRSHLVVKLFVRTKKGKKSTEGVINLVDLAGSESFSAERDAEQKEEGSKIRTSLLSLQRVLRDLKANMTEVTERNKAPSDAVEISRRSKRIDEASPSYRDSKLTQLLKDSFSRGKVLMFLTLNPQKSSLSETKNSLKFAEFVQTIHIGQSKVSVSYDVSAK
jgi:hypothetical protein